MLDIFCSIMEYTRNTVVSIIHLPFLFTKEQNQYKPI